MTFYCVRLKSDHPHHPDEIVGLFSAKSLAELWDLVDEVCPPEGTEYAVLPSGGIIWESRGPKMADLYRFEDDECIASIHDGAPAVTEMLQHAFTKGLRFKPMPEPASFQ